MDSVHYGVPPKRRCDLYGGLEGQDAQRSRRQRGFQLELRLTWFSLRALFSYLSFLYLFMPPPKTTPPGGAAHSLRR